MKRISFINSYLVFFANLNKLYLPLCGYCSRNSGHIFSHYEFFMLFVWTLFLSLFCGNPIKLKTKNVLTRREIITLIYCLESTCEFHSHANHSMYNVIELTQNLHMQITSCDRVIRTSLFVHNETIFESENFAYILYLPSTQTALARHFFNIIISDIR